MVSFVGFEMPIQYSSIAEEHMAVRKSVGVFDVSHMGEFFISGPDAEALVQRVVTNDASTLYDGRAMYTVMCNETGGIIDDLLVYRVASDEFMLVVNAANIEKDFDWIVSQNRFDTRVVNRSDDIALIAVQGPESRNVVQKLTAVDLAEIKYYHFTRSGSGGKLPEDLIISRTGYTGELGYELYCRADDAASVWRMVFDAGAEYGILPAGLGARDTLRLEAGFCLYGNDMSEETNPFQAGLGWITKLDKGPFVGSDALTEIKTRGLDRKLVAFVMSDRGIPRPGYPIVDESGDRIGEVTSGTHSPLMSCGIGMGYVTTAGGFASPDAQVFVEVRGRRLSATVTKPPLHK
jgi:aminomethyltransferase